MSPSLLRCIIPPYNPPLRSLDYGSYKYTINDFPTVTELRQYPRDAISCHSYVPYLLQNLESGPQCIGSPEKDEVCNGSKDYKVMITVAVRNSQRIIEKEHSHHPPQTSKWNSQHNMGGCQIMVPFGIPIVIRHLIFRVPKKGP